MHDKQKPFSSSVSLRQTVLDLLLRSDRNLTKNEIARQLRVKGNERVALKHILAELEDTGKLARGSRRRIGLADRPLAAAQVLVAEITSESESGNWIAYPADWHSDIPLPVIEIPLPRISSVKSARKHRPFVHLTLFVGARVLLRLRSVVNNIWQGEVIKILDKPNKVHLGIFSAGRDGGGRLSPCNRKDKFPGVRLAPSDIKNLQDGDILAYTVAPGGGVHIQKNIGRIDNPETFSLMAIHAHGLPHVFSEEALKLSRQGVIPDLKEGKIERADLRHYPLVTIDGEDARDFDDAVWATADNNDRNPGGWRILVAIADVAYYVRPGNALDKEAAERGNSVYFPDRVVPMLPESLSNELCSLKPNEDRACMAIEMILAADGKVKSHNLVRGLMRSRARLTYTQVHNAMEGITDELTAPLLTSVIEPLYGAYKALAKARLRRGVLEISQPENQVIFGTNGHIEQILPRPRYDSHRLIEEFMIAANVAAAKILGTRGWPCLYRIHDSPDTVRVANLRQILTKMKVPFAKTASPQPAHFNALLDCTKETAMERMISDLVLRSQAQARYSPENIGHYGLSLLQYAHFTSPIRRYADLIVHRSLISALNLGNDGLPDKFVNLVSAGEHLSTTERQAAIAEREVVERFITAFYAPRQGESFLATIAGVSRAGLFIALDKTAAQGFIPLRTFKGDIFVHEEHNHCLTGRRTKKKYQLGDALKVRLESADIIINSLVFEIEPEPVPVKKINAKQPQKTSVKQLKKITKPKKSR